VLVSPSGNGWQLRLADFGSGRLLDPERLANLGITALGMTLAGGVASDATRGTLMYLPPEAFQDQPSTVRGDVFALGVLLYQLLIADLGKPLVPGWERDVSDELLRADIAEATDADACRAWGSWWRACAAWRSGGPSRRAGGPSRCASGKRRTSCNACVRVVPG